MIILKQIIFRCKDNDSIKDVRMEAYELDFYIFASIENIKKTWMHIESENIVICIHPAILEFLLASDFNHINAIEGDGTTKFQIYGHRTLVSTDCFLKIMIDPTNDLFEENGCTDIKI